VWLQFITIWFNQCLTTAPPFWQRDHRKRTPKRLNINIEILIQNRKKSW